ncbi:hypothetical protein [Leptolyngbya ohadii]|uniref:hypothetical protein n=1 Tax=Leptolyngbya ohadii TaxID=1962290 RepID=UPI00117A8C50|nr:hypothetical protein [Leptolyngbya ohadii]
MSKKFLPSQKASLRYLGAMTGDREKCSRSGNKVFRAGQIDEQADLKMNALCQNGWVMHGQRSAVAAGRH